MPHRLSFVLFGMLVSCTAFATGLDPVRVGRYSAIVPGPSPEQADPFALAIHTEFPYAVQTVGHALDHVLARSGYRLASFSASCPSLPVLLAWPLPAVHRTLGPMRLEEVLKTLAGPAHTLVVDPVHRLVSFELREPYQGLVRGGGPSVPKPSYAGQAQAAPEAERLQPQLIPAPTPRRSERERGASTFDSAMSHRIGPIAPGAGLWPIAADLRATFRATAAQVMVGLFETNPKSFCHRNLHCLKAGAYLDPPSVARVAALAPSAAHRTVQRQFETWRHRTRLPVPARQTGRSPPLAERTADPTTENAEGVGAIGMLPANAGMHA